MPNGKGRVKARSKIVRARKVVQPASEPSKTSVKSIDWHGDTHFNASVIDVNNGRIVRIRPLHYDWKYRPEEFKPWKMEARGKLYTVDEDFIASS